MANLIKQNQTLVSKIVKQLAKMGAAPLECSVNNYGVIQVWDNQEIEDVISTAVAGEWYRLLAEWDGIKRDGFEDAWQALNQAQAKYGYGGTATMNPQPDKVTKYKV